MFTCVVVCVLVHSELYPLKKVFGYMSQLATSKISGAIVFLVTYLIDDVILTSHTSSLHGLTYHRHIFLSNFG